MSTLRQGKAGSADANKLRAEDRPAHDWYRFVLSYPPHLVRTYLERFGVGPRHRVLDPFCGTGTTLVECKKLGVPSVGLEANPMAHFATTVKLNWSPDPEGLTAHTTSIAESATSAFADEGIEEGNLPLFAASANGRRRRSRPHLKSLSPEKAALLLAGSISPLPLHKTLVLKEHIEAHADDAYFPHQLLALAKAVVYSISNLHFGPEVGVGPPRNDADVVGSWLTEVSAMVRDLSQIRQFAATPAIALAADARSLRNFIEARSIDAVICSPPYPNEKDYTRTTRLESVLLGFIRNKSDLRALKRELVRSNTRGVYKVDDDDRWVAGHAEIERIAEAIEARRIELGKTSGFERLYARVTKLYFGGMARHLADLRTVLRPGAHLAYVVGDQASYLRVMIRTGELLADIAKSLGYEVAGIDLFRTRLATATRQQLREEVVLLRWPGASRRFTKGASRP
jgi:DNA modification methylase